MIKASSAGALGQATADKTTRAELPGASLPAGLDAIRRARQPLFADERALTPAQAVVHGNIFHPDDDSLQEVCAPSHNFVTAAFRLMPQASPRQRASLPLHTWRQPVAGQRAVDCHADDPFEAIGHNELRHSSALRQWRDTLDAMRDRLEAFVSARSYVRNATGMLERRDFPVLYRIDQRSPQELLASDGFGPSRKVHGIAPMVNGEVLVTSACLRASDIVLNQSRVADEAGYPQQPVYQYAIRAEGMPAASWAENYRFQKDLTAREGCAPELGLDEVHVAADQVRAAHIYLIGCTDASVEQQLETILDEHAEPHFGVSIARYAECQEKDADEIATFLRHVQESQAVYNDQVAHWAGRLRRQAHLCNVANARQMTLLQGQLVQLNVRRQRADIQTSGALTAIQHSLAHGTPLAGASAARSALLLAPHIIGVLEDLPAKMGIVLVDPQQRHWRFFQGGKKRIYRAIESARPGDLMILLPGAAPPAAASTSSASSASNCHIAVAPRSGAPSWKMLVRQPASNIAHWTVPVPAEPLFQAIVDGLALAGIRQSANTPERLKQFALCSFGRRMITENQTVRQQHQTDLAFLDAAGLLWSALTASAASGADAMRQMSLAYRQALKLVASLPHKLACLLLDDRCDGISLNQKLVQFLRLHGHESTRLGPRLMHGARQFLAEHLALLRELRDTRIVNEFRLDEELARGGAGSLLRLVRENPGILRPLPLPQERARTWNANTVLRLTGQPAASHTSHTSRH